MCVWKSGRVWWGIYLIMVTKTTMQFGPISIVFIKSDLRKLGKTLTFNDQDVNADKELKD
eukprot:TRINITY_DN12005_c0_g1_i1.p1 TRINITY_DN12005_c0_g1~~TRINITY_DN12005_c0_g1_i1.p1  ORF type:complete len:60 (+),score=5.83 TRINITY_DN12005_c0_g1_i1:250-429(+)